MTNNPFTFGKPILDSSRFYNRKEEIRQIINRLLSSAHESTSVVGERRMGKTSLLNYLADPDKTAGLGLNPGQFCLVYIDFQGLNEITPIRFWNRVLGKMAKSVCDPSLVPFMNAVREQAAIDLFDLEDLFEKITTSGHNIVILMDEFETITQNPNFGPDFYGCLRALAIHKGLALIPATQKGLVDLCYSEDVKSSPFFNIFATVVLRPFSREEAYTLLEGSLRTLDIIFTPEEKEFAIKLGGGHPLFLQMAGYYLVEWKLKGFNGPALMDKMTPDFDQQAGPHFQYLWSHCSESERITLLTIMAFGKQKLSNKESSLPTLDNLVKIHAHASIDLQTLINRGMVIEVDGKYSLISPRLENWIGREISALPGEEETESSLNEWIKSSGEELQKKNAKYLVQFKKKYWSSIITILREMSLDIVSMSIFEAFIHRLL